MTALTIDPSCTNERVRSLAPKCAAGNGDMTPHRRWKTVSGSLPVDADEIIVAKFLSQRFQPGYFQGGRNHMSPEPGSLITKPGRRDEILNMAGVENDADPAFPSKSSACGRDGHAFIMDGEIITAAATNQRYSVPAAQSSNAYQKEGRFFIGFQ